MKAKGFPKGPRAQKIRALGPKYYDEWYLRPKALLSGSYIPLYSPHICLYIGTEGGTATSSDVVDVGQLYAGPQYGSQSDRGQIG